MDNIISKVQKLLKLANDPNNANEAALAAAKAQELIDRHQLSSALLALDNAVSVDSLDNKPIINFRDAPLHNGNERVTRWRGYLGITIAKHNGCKIYQSGGALMIIGRPSDAETVRYLFSWLNGEVERLATNQGLGYGKSWRNNFKLGVVDTIARKLKEQHEAANPYALMRVNQALERIAARTESVEKWSAMNMRLRKSQAAATRYDASARMAGQKAGESISLTNRSARLVNGKALNS